MFERFTRNARAVVLDAAQVARRAHAPEVLPTHLLEALVAIDGTLALHLLEDLGASRQELRQVVSRLVGAQPAVLDEDDADALRLLGIDLDDVMRRIERDLGGPSGSAGERRSTPRYSRSAKKALALSLREAIRLGDRFIGTEHLLLGLVRAGDPLTLATLAAFGLKAVDVRRAVDEAERRTG